MKRSSAIAAGFAIISGCAVLTALGLTGRADLLPKGQGLPEKDIVFIPEDTLETLGFVNSNGTGFETRTLEISEGFLRDFAKLSTLGPSVWVTWGPDGRSLAASLGRYHTGGGIPVVITGDGELLFCSEEDDSTPYSSARSWIVDGTTVMTIDEYPSGDPERVLVMDMTTCATQEVEQKVSQDLNLEEASPSSIGWLAIVALDPATLTDAEALRWLLVINPLGDEVARYPDGRWPAWSRDGEWLAYTVNDDGLYIVRKDGTGGRKVLDEPRVGLATWSPDGAWLAYDRPTGAGNEGVYKVNLATGQEVEIYRGGYYPNWSWRQGD